MVLLRGRWVLLLREGESSKDGWEWFYSLLLYCSYEEVSFNRVRVDGMSLSFEIVKELIMSSGRYDL